MKKIYILFIALAALVLTQSCTDEGGLNPPVQPENPELPQSPELPQDKDSLDFPAVQDSTAASLLKDVSVTADMGQTRSVIHGAEVKWEDGDEIALVFTHPSAGCHVASLSTQIEDKVPVSRAVFSGQMSSEVCVASGYDALGYTVYPSSAVQEDGSVVYTLPAEQIAGEDGSMAAGLNLSSGIVSLASIDETGSASSRFRNACSVLKFTLADDVVSFTLTGTSPFAGTAPLAAIMDPESDDAGRLVLMQETWEGASASVTLKPSGDCFKDGVAYNLLIWPGTHESLTLTVNYKEFGEVSKTAKKILTFEASKFYTLNFNADSESLVTELRNGLDPVIGGLTEFERDLGSSESGAAGLAGLLSQIQSVALMTEYLDNSTYASYVDFASYKDKHDITLDYVVRPVAAAQMLVDSYAEALSAVIYYKSGDFGFAELPAVSAKLDGDVMSVTFDADGISDKFYKGEMAAELALQISDGNTELLSDFAKLVPKIGSSIGGSYMDGISVVPGARVIIPFNFALADPSGAYSLTVEGYENVDGASVSHNKDFRTGTLSVDISGTKPVESQNVTLVLDADGEKIYRTFTFADKGARINMSVSGAVDYIGGDAVVNVTTQGLGDGFLTLTSGSWVTQSGNVFTFSENSGSERTASVEYSVSAGSLQYVKYAAITQRAVGTSLTKTYYSNGQKVTLNAANAGCSNYFNIVILGDGYKKKDLAVGGKFERSARSAMDSFFAVEPYKTFKNRFNVYMVAYESAEEGTDIRSAEVTKNTYFNSYCQGGGNTAAYVDGTDNVENAVKSAVGSSDAQYYRSIAILLVNTDENAGSTGYTFRDYKSGFVNGYASFAIAVLAANSTGTNGLVKHEAGGHAFGRLADEYFNGGGTASSSNKTDLSNWHAKGWYWNVNPYNTGNYYKFTNSAYSSDQVGFIEGGWGYQYGMYRPTQGGMMQNNNGVFNAPSRHAIYHRIITESQGADAYRWSDFLAYDKKNLN